MSSSFNKSNLLQFDTDDIDYSHRTQKRKKNHISSLLLSQSSLFIAYIYFKFKSI